MRSEAWRRPHLNGRPLTPSLANPLETLISRHRSSEVPTRLGGRVAQPDHVFVHEIMGDQAERSMALGKIGLASCRRREDSAPAKTAILAGVAAEAERNRRSPGDVPSGRPRGKRCAGGQSLSRTGAQLHNVLRLPKSTQIYAPKLGVMRSPAYRRRGRLQAL